MTAMMNAQTGKGPLLPSESVCATVRQPVGTAGRAYHPDGRILATTGTAVLIELASPHIACTAVLCVQRGATRLDESDGNVSWWCLDHGTAALVAIADDECRTVRDAVRAMAEVAA